MPARTDGETVKPGDIVRMNAACKKALFATGSHDHVKEFGRCYGVVLGPTDYGNQQGPEVDVRWKPSDLKYAYAVEHLTLMKLKAFYVEGYDEEQGCTLVYAFTPAQARALGRDELEADYIDTKAYRKPEYDERCAGNTEPYVEHDTEWQRQNGWRLEGDRSCDTCGLYPNGLDKYEVCWDCNQCKECGCLCEEDDA